MVRTTVLAFCFALTTLFGMAQAANKHYGGHDAIKNKPDGKHAVHKTPAGHVAYAHVKGGKVGSMSVMHPKGKPVATQKVASKQKLHAMGNAGDEVYFVNAEAQVVVVAWVGWRFFNDISGNWIYIWYPARFVIGGSAGAIVVGAS
jgi:hypothetical protein